MNEIIVGNKLIAEFMGANMLTDETLNLPYMNSEWYDLMELKYHSSWDWLMPVCIKINSKESIKYCESNGMKDSIICYINAMRLMKRGAISFDIQKTWQGAIEFIKWFNLQK